MPTDAGTAKDVHMEFSCAETTDSAESATTRTMQRVLTAVRKANGGDSVGHIDSNAEKNVPAIRKGSSKLTSTRSSVNDASTTSRLLLHLCLIRMRQSVFEFRWSLGHSARLNGLSVVKRAIWSEMLWYIHFYRDKSNINALRQVLLDFFLASDISDGKKIMALEFNTVDGAAQFLADRRNSTARLAHEAELDDVLGIFDAADAVLALDEYFFMASRLDQFIPKFGPEEVNLGVVVERQVKMDSAIQSLVSVHPAIIY